MQVPSSPEEGTVLGPLELESQVESADADAGNRAQVLYGAVRALN